jgi:hypothetical protein
VRRLGAAAHCRYAIKRGGSEKAKLRSEEEKGNGSMGGIDLPGLYFTSPRD